MQEARINDKTYIENKLPKTKGETMGKTINSKKQLAVELSKLKQIEGVDRGLEQYQTDSELAADILWNALMLDDIEDNVVFDLGCGNGIFGIGCMMLGATEGYFVDKDPKAINIAQENISRIDESGKSSSKITHLIKEDIDTWNKDIVDEKKRKSNKHRRIIMMNPPFGTKEKHADKTFLEKAFSIGDVVYSIHKLETVGFLRSISKDNGFKVDKTWEYEFGIKKSHAKHKKKTYGVKVLCARFVKESQ